MSRGSILRAAATVAGLLALAVGRPAWAKSGADGASATELNNQGFAEYKAGHYPDAEKLFRAAIKKDPKHKLANYNLACVLALLWIAPNDSCQEDPGLDRMLEQLKRAVQVDAAVATKARKDRDFERVRKLSSFWQAIGANPRDPEVVRAIFPKSAWFTQSIYYATLSFASSGRYTYSPSRDPGADDEEESQGETGSYQIGKDGTIRLRSDKGRVTTVKLNQEWNLQWIEDGAEEGMHFFSDFPCPN